MKWKVFENPHNKLEISIVIILQLVIIAFLYIALKPPKKTKQDAELAEVAFKIQFYKRVHEQLQNNSEKAKELSEKGLYTESAILHFQEAAARECLLPELRMGFNKQPTIGEEMALMRFQQAMLNGDEMGDKGREAYKQLLKLKYPDWTE